MPPRPVLLGVAASLVLVLVASASGAQERPATPSATPQAAETSGLHAGDRIVMRTLAFDTAGSSTTCRASVTRVSGDTAVLDEAVNPQFLRRSRGCPSHTFLPGEITELSVIRGDRGSRVVHTVLGALTGAAAGAIYATVSSNRRPAGSNHEDDGLIAVLSVEVGAVAGGLVGIFLPAGNKWERIRHIPPSP